jgi:hypothetical protein
LLLEKADEIDLKALNNENDAYEIELIVEDK